jgi:hypothetical protein
MLPLPDILVSLIVLTNYFIGYDLFYQGSDDGTQYYN